MEQPVLTLALTILLEYGVYLVWIRREPAKLLLYAVLVNTLTQPPGVFIYLTYRPPLWLVELVIWGVESVLLVVLLRRPLREAAWLSFAANLLTTLVGIIFF